MASLINWFSLPVADLDRANAFYNTILATELIRTQGPDGSDTAFFTDPESGMYAGALSTGAHLQPGKEGAQIFFNVDGTMDAVLQRITRADGTVLMSKTGIGEFGYIASFLDSEGNMIGLHSAS